MAATSVAQTREFDPLASQPAVVAVVHPPVGGARPIGGAACGSHYASPRGRDRADRTAPLPPTPTRRHPPPGLNAPADTPGGCVRSRRAGRVRRFLVPPTSGLALAQRVVYGPGYRECA